MVRYQPAGNNLTPLTHAALMETSSQYQPTQNGSCIHPPTQYLAARESNIPTAIVDTQLTHPISQDDGTEMPAAPLTHDISTPRRLSGGRCRKWAVSTQPAADKRRCVSCTMCGQQFSHGEPRLQQWCNSVHQRLWSCSRP